MFCENLKALRRARGLSQESIAQRMYVTRQTVSKWENGLSVPDADALIRLAEILEAPVSQLLGTAQQAPQTEESIAQKLEQLNLLLAQRNARSRRIWKAVAILLVGLAVFTAALLLLNFVSFQGFSHTQENVQSIQASSFFSE